jgi:uncharacterized oligopeptide transporter (OPT) family protein
MNKSAKVLIMAIVGFLGSLIASSGLPATITGWEILGITTVCFTISYIAKNQWLPSNKIFDIVSALLLALSVGVSDWLATLATSTPFDWTALWKLCVSVVVGYFGKNIWQNQLNKTQ